MTVRFPDTKDVGAIRSPIFIGLYNKALVRAFNVNLSAK